MEELLQLLSEIRPDVDFEAEDELMDADVLDSFDVITIVSEIQDKYNIEIDVADIVPDNFNSAELIWKLIERCM
ncbi:MAG: acyl carrier protein [Lachnospiraceae bacterium]|nr:acyl carrier protein [Candidatus Colinaster equi]